MKRKISRASLCSVLSRASLCSVLLGLSGLSVVADETSKNIGVMDRARPEYDATGIRAGSFILKPRLQMSTGLDDNVFADEDNEEEDLVYSLSPSLALQSDFSRHNLQAEVYVDDRRYNDNDDEDHTDWGILAEGRLDVQEGSSLRGTVGYEFLNEDRGSSDAPGPGTTPGAVAAEPTEHEKLGGSLVLSHRFNKITTEVGASYTKLDYDDVADTLGGIIDQDSRDRESVESYIEIGYDVSPDYNVFIRSTMIQDDYDQEPPTTAVDRDGEGYEVVAGAKFDISNMIVGEAYIGYLEHEYDDASFSDVSDVAYGADLSWYVTELMTIRGYASKSVEVTTTPGASGRLQRRLGLGVDYELRRNVLLSGDVSHSTSEYEGISRKDNETFADIGMDYLVNRNFSLRFDVSRHDRDSNIAGLDYSHNRVLLHAIVKR